MKILIGATGSVASIKVPELIDLLKLSITNAEIKVIATEHAKDFFSVNHIADKVCSFYDDNNEWDMWKKLGDPVLHIELRRWADVLVIAPADANTMAKMANGICDNLLTCVVRAWDCRKPLLYCPSMNTLMYEHPLTRKHQAVLKEFGYVEIPCVTKMLACGDNGIGAMASVRTIVTSIQSYCKQ